MALEYPTLFVNPRYPKNYWAAINVSPRQAQITWHNHCIFKRTMLSVLSDWLIDKVVFDQEMFHVYSQNLCYFLEGIHWFLQHGNKRNFHVLWTFQVAYYNIHTTKDSLAPLFYLQQCSSRWANPPCYRVIELLMDFVSSYQKEIRQIFPIKQKYYQTAGFWVLLHSHLSSFCQKGWDGRELLVCTDHFKGWLWKGISTRYAN